MERLLAKPPTVFVEHERVVERYNPAFEASPTPLLLVDSSGRILLSNKQLDALFGYQAQELLQQQVDVLVPREARVRHPGLRDAFFDYPKARRMGTGRDLYGVCKAGRRIPVEIGLTPVAFEGQALVLVAVLDITERKQREAEIREKNEQLSRLNEELSQFAYSASHDLKAPLATIRGLVGVLQDDLKEGRYDEVDEVMRRIKSLTLELATLIEDLLALARTDPSDDQLSEVDFEAAVRAAFAQVVDAATKQGVSLVCEALPQVLLRTQPRRLLQILNNLVMNAVKYSDPAQPERYVRVGGDLTAQVFKFWVKDNGLGIPRECHTHVFKMFRRFHPRVSGSGLGLALVKKHVQLLGGEISFESSESGTLFFVSLPSHARTNPEPDV